LDRWCHAIPSGYHPRLFGKYASALSGLSRDQDQSSGKAGAGGDRGQVQIQSELRKQVPSSMAMLLALFPAILMALRQVPQPGMKVNTTWSPDLTPLTATSAHRYPSSASNSIPRHLLKSWYALRP
jgi:hypothetical protein